MSGKPRIALAAALWCVRPRALAVALACALGALALGVPGGAEADVFGPISLISEGDVPGAPAGEVQQAEEVHDTAISGDGRYVVFDGSFHGVVGVWRAEVQGGRVVGELEQVAGGDAAYPSISENGQFVSFTTDQGKSLGEVTYGLDGELPQRGAGVKEAANVYVRDMSLAPTQVGAFIAASAQNGSDEPLIYAGAETSTGAVATGRSAISADGNEVAFVTTAISDLASPGEVNTPPLQVAVRYIASRETKLVSVNRETGGPVSFHETGKVDGAVYPGAARDFAPPPQYAAWAEAPPLGASISADGSTVAWMGEDVNLQVAMLPGERRNPNYTEPLWRRIAPGSETATERVTGGSDPTAPGCAASGETALPLNQSPTDPCQGPFAVQENNPGGGIWTGGSEGDFVPRLSADGYTVAFLSKAPLVTAGENSGRGTGGQESDLYVANMHPGLARDQALTQLTELAGAGTSESAPIFDFDISPDGSQVAFATRRTQFPLGSPAFVSPPAGEPGLNELFDVDLRNDTLTRVSHGYLGPDEAGEHAHGQALAGQDPYEQQPGDGATSPSFADDGNIIAFASTAANFAFGDGNAPPATLGDGSDAFLVQRTVFQPLPTPDYVSPAPETTTKPAWELGMTTLSRPDGSVLAYIRTPGAGTLRAVAQGSVELASAGHSARVHARRHARRGRAAGVSGGSHVTVAVRTVAAATRAAPSPSGELVALVLTLAKPYAALAAEPGGLSATVTVSFAAAGEPTLQQSMTVIFARTAKAAHAAHKAHRASTSRKRRKRR